MRSSLTQYATFLLHFEDNAALKMILGSENSAFVLFDPIRLSNFITFVNWNKTSCSTKRNLLLTIRTAQKMVKYWMKKGNEKLPKEMLDQIPHASALIKNEVRLLNRKSKSYTDKERYFFLTCLSYLHQMGGASNSERSLDD